MAANRKPREDNLLAFRKPNLTLEEQLPLLEQHFKRVALSRPKLAKILKISDSRKALGKFRQKSFNHHKMTSQLLRLIDNYVTMHKKALPGKEIILPRLMRQELETLKIHRTATVSNPSANLKKALDVHNRKLLGLHAKAEQIIGKHGIAFVLSERKRA